MPLQNRVTPFGSIVAHPAKGTLMGNRGCLHDAQKRLTGRRWTTQSWVTCALQFKGWQRRIMTPGNYTELFFLDEATALAAGHRPCAECRRERFNTFMTAWSEANPLSSQPRARVTEVDPIMHKERKVGISARPTMLPDDVPDGAMVSVRGSDAAWLRWENKFHLWSFAGYSAGGAAPAHELLLLTPPSTARALQAGFRPEVHPSLQRSK